MFAHQVLTDIHSGKMQINDGVDAISSFYSEDNFATVKQDMLDWIRNHEDERIIVQVNKDVAVYLDYVVPRIEVGTRKRVTYAAILEEHPEWTSKVVQIMVDFINGFADVSVEADELDMRVLKNMFIYAAAEHRCMHLLSEERERIVDRILYP